jgi:hypothetical protein
VQDVDGMMSISTEAAEARASLKDDRELVRTFEVSFSSPVLNDKVHLV